MILTLSRRCHSFPACHVGLSTVPARTANLLNIIRNKFKVTSMKEKKISCKKFLFKITEIMNAIMVMVIPCDKEDELMV